MQQYDQHVACTLLLMTPDMNEKCARTRDGTWTKPMTKCRENIFFINEAAYCKYPVLIIDGSGFSKHFL